MGLKQQIISDLTGSMKAQDAARTSTLRMVKAALVNREIEKGGELDDEEMMKLLRSMVKQRRDSVEQYEKGGRQDLANKEQAEITIIESYLPQAASREAIDEVVAAVIADTGATSMKDMGKVMKAAQERLAGRNADGRTVSEVVKAKLS
ncbi:MAG TPA: GatB/YqeY domain-containing protein [Pyrinomonadaceae bacterium]|nr:GatB/YqeY domain-containing protein [Pyrinomonadaceae bacterium]